ncbi:hypothetical protein J7T55_002849 [Diaporthe amygdali]|uniref:uncharacterized protein n=1 Tax=Phomopsis amygdali TaxID=1214568 RepID=UPI0022FF2B8B|nr:uncharacterized protein J7T55_002849 [Diaporthe amygdali]KAJ0122336.1 hypothetical protein J7T55_002849 [Diaporthe amygdali]
MRTESSWLVVYCPRIARQGDSSETNNLQGHKQSLRSPLLKQTMASAPAMQPLIPKGPEPAKDFYHFPDFPPELRLRIWELAYDAVPDTLVYQFALVVEPAPGTHDGDETFDFMEYFLVPMDEVRDLTRELRSLRRVNKESRHESVRLFDSCLHLNQTKQGETSSSCPPIDIPWKSHQNYLCLKSQNVVAGFDKKDNMAFIEQAFENVRLLAFGVDASLSLLLTFTADGANLADLITCCPNVQHVALVSDLLMYDGMKNLFDRIRSGFRVSFWDDWVGRVEEGVISPYEESKNYDMGDHWIVLKMLRILLPGVCKTKPEHALLSRVVYGMIFRTRKNWRCMLRDDESLGDLRGDGSTEESSEGSDDA